MTATTYHAVVKRHGAGLCCVESNAVEVRFDEPTSPLYVHGCSDLPCLGSCTALGVGTGTHRGLFAHVGLPAVISRVFWAPYSLSGCIRTSPMGAGSNGDPSMARIRNRCDRSRLLRPRANLVCHGS